jgi:hypothetical protein
VYNIQIDDTHCNPYFKLKWSQTNDLKMTIKVSRNTTELMGSGEFVIFNKVFMKKEDLLKKWINLNNPNVVKKSKLSLLDQIKINIYVEIFYDNIFEMSESVKTSLTSYTEKSQSSKNKVNKDREYNTTRKSAGVSLSNNNSFMKSFDNKVEIGKLTTARGSTRTPTKTVNKDNKKSVDERPGRYVIDNQTINNERAEINSIKIPSEKLIDLSADSEFEMAEDGEKIDEYIRVLDEFKTYYNDSFTNMYYCAKLAFLMMNSI